MSSIDEIVSKAAIEGLVKTNAEIIKVDEATKAWIKSLETISASLRQNDITIKQVNAAQKEVEKSTNKLTALEKEQVAAEKALEKQRQSGLAAMAKQEAKERELSAAINKEVKSINDLKAQTNALIQRRNALDKTTASGKNEYDKLTASINKNNNELKANDSQIGNNQRRVGSYGDALKGVGTKILGFAAGLGVALGATELFKSVLGSTDAITDAFAKNMEGGKQSVDYLARAIANMDFSNLIQGMKDAFEEGKRYADVLDEIEDRQRSLGLQKLDIEGQIIDQKIIAKSRKTDIKDKEAAIAEIIRLEQLKLDKTSDIAKQGIENELSNAAQISGIQAEVIEDFVTNYDDYSQRIKDGIELQNKLNSLITTTQSASGFIVKDYYKRDEALKNLTETEKESIRFAELSNKIVKDKRDLIAAAIEIDKEATNAQKQSGEELVRLQNRLYSEYIKEEDQVVKLGEKKVKLAEDAEKAAQKELEARVNLVTEKRKLDEGAAELLNDFDNEYFKGLDEQLKYAEETYKKETEILDEQLKQEAKLRDDQREDQRKKDEEELERKKEIAYGVLETVNFVGQLALESNQSELDQKAEQNATQRDWELQMAGDDADKKDAINKKYAEKEKQLKVEQAKQTKKVAMFNAAINFASALIAALTIPPPASFIAEAFTAVLAGAQLIAIAAKPIPQFYKGTKNAPAGVISIAERGRELTETKTGKLLMFNKPTITSGLQGAKIYTNEQTERIMNTAGNDSPELRVRIFDSKIEKAIERGLSNQTHYSFETERVVKKRGNYSEIWYNRKLKGVRND